MNVSIERHFETLNSRAAVYREEIRIGVPIREDEFDRAVMHGVESDCALRSAERVNIKRPMKEW